MAKDAFLTRGHGSGQQPQDAVAAEKSTAPVPQLMETKPIPQKVLSIRGFKLPEVMQHGTTLGVVGRRRSADGSYSCMSMDIIDATSGDARAWPKLNAPLGSRAVLVFSTDLAFSPELGGDTGRLDALVQMEDSSSNAHIRFLRLPPGSYEIISSRDVDFNDPPYPMTGPYQRALTVATNRMIQKARAARENLKK